MSYVYKAQDFKVNRFGAVKILKQEFSIKADFVSKFRIEAQVAAGIMHPNIIDVYDAGEESGFYYIMMKLVEGITLRDYIECLIEFFHVGTAVARLEIFIAC